MDSSEPITSWLTIPATWIDACAADYFGVVCQSGVLSVYIGWDTFVHPLAFRLSTDGVFNTLFSSGAISTCCCMTGRILDG